MVATALKQLLLLLRYPRFSTTLIGTHNVGALRVRIPGSTGCQIHYPIGSSKSASRISYFRPKAVEGLADYSGTSPALLSMLSARKLQCLEGADIMNEPFPVILFSHGLGGCMEMYSQLCTNMASHGFVVFALEHEDGSGCFAETHDGGEPIYYKRPDNTPYSRNKVLNFRGPMLEQRVKEVEKAVQYIFHSDKKTCDDPQFKKILEAIDDQNGVSLVGHSFGAATMALAAQRESFELNTVAFLDPWAFPLEDSALRKGVSQAPVLSILSESWTTSTELPQVLELLEKSKDKSLWWMPDTVHQSFADSANWLPSFVARRMGMRGKKEKRHSTSRAVAEMCTAHIARENGLGGTTKSGVYVDQLGPYSESLLKPYLLPTPTVEMAKV